MAILGEPLEEVTWCNRHDRHAGFAPFCRYDSGRGGSYDYSYYRGEEYGTHHNPYLNETNMPSNGNVVGFEEGWERHGMPPPPAPPIPNGGPGPHAAAHQVGPIANTVV